ncbi:MAG: zinc ribbon domain-containing protein [Thermoleophilia bacterium]|nr:zinc ribbon domain-containing protein [Thermoleophilia bacterium]
MGLFGRGKRDTSGSVCAECGRSLLAGELTHRIVDEDGNERLICSLCGRPSAEKGKAHVFTGSAPEPGDKDRSDSDTFWRALKEKDAQIEHLEARLARSEAERQELAGQLALLRAESEGAAPVSPETAVLLADDEVTGEHALAAEAPYDEQGVAEAPPIDAPQPEAPPAVAALDEAAYGEESEAPAEEPAIETGHAAEAGEPAAGEDTAAIPALAEAAAAAGADDAGESTIVPADEPDEGVSSLTLLQRGVDILNVSPVPRKVADTSADLGVPQVHVGFDGQTAAVTFLWSLGWYRFAVDIEGAGSVRLAERGYEDRPDLQPNASVRPDGTVQLAPAQLSRAARDREPATPPEEEASSGRRTPRDAAERPPEIVSQSLLGQRTDDEKPSWEQTQARDFNW